MEYPGKSLHTLGEIQYIDLISIMDLFYAICHMDTQTLALTLTGFQGIKRCVHYLASHPHKPIFDLSNYYGV